MIPNLEVVYLILLPLKSTIISDLQTEKERSMGQRDFTVSVGH